ncbi:HlyD family secretion protein [Iodobacter sp. CM08]|uniref:HlyD family secretion protein n=1 Tax=Iodobacter sp. CM08 TaxID=3085902 RepID=UPI002981D786|nr:HlyD family secretion protein [Iodobacter sp. CM08]MDW5419064.1 HlyD family secretion protein [Iodobacter sp. CM08]
MKKMIKILITLAIVSAAIFTGLRLWNYYEVEPWTRNGRIRVQVIQVAPDVSGQITAVAVKDNQQVKTGDLLFEIDTERFTLSLRQAAAAELAQRSALKQAEREAQRNRSLSGLLSQESIEQTQAKVESLQAALAQAVANHDVAKLNLARSRIYASVNGVVTNLDLQKGGFATAGKPMLALLDRDSFYVEGYFEETKLDKIHLNDSVTMNIMGQKTAITGHVESIAAGITDRDRGTGSNLLPNINPTFNWVRLAQRIPVRVALDKIPADVRLVSGQTVTVNVNPNTKR